MSKCEKCKGLGYILVKGQEPIIADWCDCLADATVEEKEISEIKEVQVEEVASKDIPISENKEIADKITAKVLDLAFNAIKKALGDEK